MGLRGTLCGNADYVLVRQSQLPSFQAELKLAPMVESQTAGPPGDAVGLWGVLRASP